MAWIGAIVVVGLFIVIATLLRTADTGVYFRLADQVSMVVLGLFFAGGFLLLARPRVRADANGIEVRNIVQTRSYTWDQVVRIAFPDSASWARLDLPDDEYLPVLAIQAVDRQRAVAAITELRGPCTRRTSSPGSNIGARAARPRSGGRRPVSGASGSATSCSATGSSPRPACSATASPTRPSCPMG